LMLSCLSGFFGDIILQVLVGLGFGGETGWGLKVYFEQHGSLESAFTAAGMMTLFYVIYILVLKLPLKIEYLALYGILLDLVFRYSMLFPSLQGYYQSLNIVESAVWGAIPMILPLIIMYLSTPFLNFYYKGSSTT
jgi:hypothetical protein